MNIKNPTENEVNRYLKKWSKLDNYVLQDKSLKKLFDTYPLNNKIEDVLIKVCALNSFYSTNIYSHYEVAKHIISLKIDQKFKKGDLNIVHKIANGHGIKIKDTNKNWNFYSFATKYCSNHKPTEYPIYDKYVEKMLMHFKKKDKFSVFKKSDIKNYPKYKSILEEFRIHYKLQSFNLKETDKYLWLAGKDLSKK